MNYDMQAHSPTFCHTLEYFMDTAMDEGMPSSMLADLPEDVLERVLAAAAGRAISTASCTCKRLKDAKVRMIRVIKSLIGLPHVI